MSTDPKTRFEENNQISNNISFPTGAQIKSDNVNNPDENTQSLEVKPTLGSSPVVQLNSNEFLMPTLCGFSKEDPKSVRKERIVKRKRKLVKVHVKRFSENVLELFYLENNVSGNYLDLKSARRKNNSALLEYLQKHTLETHEPDMLIRALFGRNPFPVPANVTIKSDNSKDSEPEVVKDEDIFSSSFQSLESSSAPVLPTTTSLNAEDEKSPSKKLGTPVSKRLLSPPQTADGALLSAEGKKLPSGSPMRPVKADTISEDELISLSGNSKPTLPAGETPYRRKAGSFTIPLDTPRPESVSTISDDDLILLSGSNTPSKNEEDTPVKRWPVGPKPPKKYSEKMKAEASVMQRIQDLQKEGMWYDKRLPKCSEPPRHKAHWDYLLEEMTWLSADFVYERKWKILAAKKCSKMIEKYFNDKAIATQRAEKEEEIRKRRQCTYLAKEIRNFWANAQKLVEMSEKSRIEQLRKKALDVHLSFIVKQTEKYSNMLAETFATKSGSKTSVDGSNLDSPRNISEEELSDPGGQDDDFEPLDSEEDDEETIITAEAEAAKDKSAVEQEVALLAEESEIPMDDFLDQLPEGYLDWRLGPGKDIDGVSEKSPGRSSRNSVNSNELNEQGVNESSDTSLELEDNSNKGEKTALLEDGVKKLKTESNMKETPLAGSKDREEVKITKEIEMPPDNKDDVESSIKIIANEISINEEEPDKKEEEKPEIKKENTFDASMQENGSESEEWDSNSDSEEYDDTEGSETEVGTDEDEDPDQTIGLASLLQTFAPERAGEDHDDTINSVAAEAESFQPKGYTLSSTTVVTKVPFLLKHTLREYQHIGLDWLVAMYTKKLNGILADEMGLGKTIQTIALLAHLACEKGNWGPHLIVVPTSVMLNWEMEFKKWCPGFKILTYYGLQKERKLKRQGWTKPNAFHICITSYKLVIQDHQSFRRKRWKYLILDEAQNIKNFKSQRWQLLLNFQTQRRLLLTGTPLQNNLMELWSLMHFLMPTVFQSHREFREWFSDPVSDMVEGDSSYDDNIIQRLHKVLRPFILRRLKSEVEKQLPQKYNHVILCRLSKRQRYLYEEYMERSNTKETLNKGNLLSVINVLMQLRKVCNHPNLFEPRPIISPFQVVGIDCTSPSLVWNIMDENKFNLPSFALYKITAADYHFGKEYSQIIWNRRYTFDREIKHLDEKQSDKPNISDFQYNSHQVMVESNDYGKRPPYKRSKYTEPPPIPQIDCALPFFMTSVDPTPYLQDEEFVEAVSYGARSKILNHSETITVNGGQKFLKVHRRSNEESSIKSSPSRAGREEDFQNSSILKDSDYLEDDSQSRELLMPHNSQESVPTKSPFSKFKFDVSNLTAQQLKIAEAKYTTCVGMKKYLEALPDSRKRKIRINKKDICKSWLQSVGYSNPDEFLLPEIQHRRLQNKHDLLIRLKKINEERCKVLPLIGKGTVNTCEAFVHLPSMRYYGYRRRRLQCEPPVKLVERNYSSFCYFHLGVAETVMSLYLKLCCPGSSAINHPLVVWRMTKALMDVTWTLQERLQMLYETIKRFVIYVPAVSVPKPHAKFFRPRSTYYYRQVQMDHDLEQHLRRPVEILHPIVSRMSTQFPDPRLIEYDCGKLQVLNRLLRALKAEDHRVLLFTQMAKMLDVLEAFLNYHGHIYLRLDGATKIEERQMLMERFNSDKRIFCFILSTRSGGIGVNLTGADTVIFYDSDWNPTMDAQAQDRCHRIGQTRDVNIYRLISERTIEENILKKSNQKRILGELAIEGGNFTTAYFKKDSIFDLFNVDGFENDPLQRIRSDLESSTSVMDHSGVYTRYAKTKEETPIPEESEKTHIFEKALAEAEDETDVQAARTVQAEAAAELAEFDESIPLEDNSDDEDMLPKTDLEMTIISAELTPVERYALRFMEHYIDDWSRETVSSAKREIEHQKREWELEQLRKSEEEKMTKEGGAEDVEDMITYPASEARNKVWISDCGSFDMPIWGPPTPPTNDNDVYIDQCHSYLYEYETMAEHMLPAVYIPPPPKIKKAARQQAAAEKRDTSVEAEVWKETPAITSSGEFVTSELDEAMVNKKTPKVQRRDEPIFAPRSLFDKPSPALAKLRRDFRMQKYNPGRPVTTIPKTALGTGAITFPITPPSSQKPVPLPTPENIPEWTINEDYALLQTVTNVLELPLSLLVVNLAQTPNWDLAAEYINLTNKTYRTPKQCKYRYETVVGPREEGKLFFETPPTAPTTPPTPPTVKKKKSKAFIKIGPPSPARTARLKTTAQLMAQDNNSQLSTMFTQKFDLIKSVMNRKVPANKPMAINPHLKQSKQAAIFAEHGINYDNPLPATTIAQTRFERLQLERKKLIAAQQVAAAAAAASAAAAGGMHGNSGANANILSPSILAAMSSTNQSAIPVSAANVQGGVQIGNVAVTTGQNVNVGVSVSSPGTEVVQKTRQLSNVTNLTNTQNVLPVVISQSGELVSRNTMSAHLLSPQRNQINLSQQTVQLQHQLQILQHNQLQAKHKQLQFSLAAQSGTVSGQQQTLTQQQQQQILKAQQQTVQMQPPHHGQQQGQTVVLSAGLAQALGTAVGSPVTVTATPGGNVTISTAGSGNTVSSLTTVSARNQQLLAQQTHVQHQQQQIQKTISTISMQDLVSVSSPQRLTQSVTTTMTSTTLQSQSTPSTIVSLTPATVIGTGQQIATKMVPGQGNVAALVSTSPKVPATMSMKGSNVNTMQLQFVRQGALIRQPSTAGTASQQQQIRDHLQNQQIKRIQMVTSTGQTAIVSSASVGSAISVSVAASTMSAVASTIQSATTPISSLPVSLVQASPMMTVSTSTPLGTVATVVTPGNTRQVQLVKQHTVGGKTVTRAISESEVAAILKQHGLSNSTRLAIASTSGGTQLTSQKGQVTQVQVPVGSLGNNQTHTLLTSVNLQNLGFKMQQSGTGNPVATIVKTPVSQAGQSGTAVFPLTLSQVKNVGKGSAVATKQQQLQLNLQQQLMNQQRRQQQQQQQLQNTGKITHITQVTPQGTMPTQLIVQATPKQLQNAIAQQQFQQVFKQVSASGQILGQGGQVLQAHMLSKPISVGSVPTTMAMTTSVAGSSVIGGANPIVSQGPTSVTVSANLINTAGQNVHARIVPVSSQAMKSSVQVVSAPNTLMNTGNLARPQITTANTNLNFTNLKMASGLSQSPGSLQGQPLAIRLQTPGLSNPSPIPTESNSAPQIAVASSAAPVVTAPQITTVPPTTLIVAEEIHPPQPQPPLMSNIPDPGLPTTQPNPPPS